LSTDSNKSVTKEESNCEEESLVEVDETR
jgi:peptide chain release factor subunit 3